MALIMVEGLISDDQSGQYVIIFHAGPIMNAISKTGWHSKIPSLKYARQIWIDGKPHDARSGKEFACISPIDGQVLTQIAAGDAADIDLAVQSARKAFEDGRWSRLAPTARKTILLRLVELMRHHAEELALLETLDMGKPISDSLNVDVPLAASHIAYMAEAIDKVYDAVAPTGPKDFVTLRHEPLGVIGAVVPWNFPLLMAAWKIGPALASGNCVVLKPAEQSPLTALRLAQLATEAGLPDGVLNVVSGFGETAGKALGLHADVDMVAFTGSTEVGKFFMRYAADSNMKRISLECGGKSPHIVLPDYDDLDTVAEAALWAIYYNQGEACNAGSRLFVHRSQHAQLVEKIAEKARTIRQGDPLDPLTQMGAMVDQRQMQRVLGYVETGCREGAKLALGGQQVMADTGGFYIAPTILDHVDNGMTVAQKEIFGPVLSVLPWDSEEEVLTKANQTIYGLAAGIWTHDVRKIHHFADRLKSGHVYINCWDRGAESVPFGGVKQSGFGRDKGIEALHKYCDVKVVWLALDR